MHVVTSKRTPLLPVDDAWRQAVALARPVQETEHVACSAAVGRVVAETVRAPIDLPPFDASAMDGYAVASSASAGAGVKRWRVVARSAAGHPATRHVGAGEAVRIFTGAALPPGADAVVLQEDVVATGETIESGAPVQAEQNVRRRGNDVPRGAELCAAGTKLTAYHLAWFAACGIDTVRVTRPVRVALLSTGDELAAAGAPLAPGQIYDSNRFALATLLRQKPVEVQDFGCVPDRLDATRSALGEAARRADLIVVSGGVSVGEADFVRDAVADAGSLDFWRIALKPGKPLAVGRVGDALFFGLPGNPVSTIVTYLLFVAPAVDALAGTTPVLPLGLSATLTGPVRHTPGRREYLRGVARRGATGLQATVAGDQGSNRIGTLANANCLVVADEEKGDLAAGDEVRVLLLGGERDHLHPAAFE